MGQYVVDSNFFIQAHRIIYPLDVAASFWNKLKQLADERKIISIDKVKNELYHNDDALKQWCEANLPGDFFKETSQVLPAYGRIVSWAMSKSSHYLQKALDEFMDADEADAWLVAYALTYNDTVVTHEVSEPNRKSKIKIPDVCISLGVQYTNTIEMFRQLRERF